MKHRKNCNKQFNKFGGMGGSKPKDTITRETRPSLARPCPHGARAMQDLCRSITCSITGEIMKDPVMAADNFTYERSAIQKWFDSGHRNSPLGGFHLNDTTLRPNIGMKHVIDVVGPQCESIDKKLRTGSISCPQFKKALTKAMSIFRRGPAAIMDFINTFLAAVIPRDNLGMALITLEILIILIGSTTRYISLAVTAAAAGATQVARQIHARRLRDRALRPPSADTRLGARGVQTGIFRDPATGGLVVRGDPYPRPLVPGEMDGDMLDAGEEAAGDQANAAEFFLTQSVAGRQLLERRGRLHTVLRQHGVMWDANLPPPPPIYAGEEAAGEDIEAVRRRRREAPEEFLLTQSIDGRRSLQRRGRLEAVLREHGIHVPPGLNPVFYRL